eukprot:3562546-Amphidinium_carterae.1
MHIAIQAVAADWKMAAAVADHFDAVPAPLLTVSEHPSYPYLYRPYPSYLYPNHPYPSYLYPYQHLFHPRGYHRHVSLSSIQTYGDLDAHTDSIHQTWLLNQLPCLC